MKKGRYWKRRREEGEEGGGRWKEKKIAPGSSLCNKDSNQEE